MINDFRDVIASYSIVGIIIAILTAFVRPFVSFWQTFRESLVVFVFSTIGGLILEQWSETISESCRYGLSGLFGFFANRLYVLACVLINQITNHPEIILKNKDK